RGRHVSLEPLQLEHVPALLEAANASRSSYAFTLVPAEPAGMRAYVEQALSEQARGDSLPFAVRDRDGAICGSTRYLQIERWTWPGGPSAPASRPEPPRDGPAGAGASSLPGIDAVEIGYTWYAERVQRTALNTEAKLLLCSHAFETWKVRRVTWKTHALNQRSRQAIARLGARFDGILRATGPAVDGSVRDTAYF